MADIESNVRTNHKINNNNNYICEKIIIIIICGIFMLPFGITSVYFAYTDNSCVNLPAGKLYANLKDYLAVDGILLLVYFGLIIISSCVNIEVLNTIYVKILSGIGKMFSLAWTITGAVIFWSLIDKNKCDTDIYNYMYASLIIKLVFTGIEAIQQTKRNK